MSAYRIYSVDRAGKIIAGEWLNASSDEEAVTLVRALNRESSCEIWNRTTFVAAIPAGNEATQPMLGLNPATNGA
jgi:hypothetical protein